MPTRGQMGIPHRSKDWEAAGLTKSMGTREEDLPFDWGPGTENYPTGNSENSPKKVFVQPTEEEWQEAIIRGWSKSGKECRVLHWCGSLSFVERATYGEGFSYTGEVAFADFPALTQRMRNGQPMGYHVRDPATGQEVLSPVTDGKWITIGKVEVYKGITPGWVTEHLGNSKMVKVIRHCRVIDVSGKDVPLKGW